LHIEYALQDEQVDLTGLFDGLVDRFIDEKRRTEKRKQEPL
jgi:hypothetical protein